MSTTESTMEPSDDHTTNLSQMQSQSSSDTANSSSAPNSAQTAIEIWRQVNLNGRRAQLDQQGLDIADRQEKSAASRKQLSVSTRSFKRSVSDGNNISTKDFSTLLRQYQSEIDALTQRAKASESAFLSLYKALYDAPDPVEELSKASNKSTSDAQKLSDLQREIDSLNAEKEGLVVRGVAASAAEKKIEELQNQLKEAGNKFADEAQSKIEQKHAQWVATQQKAIEAYEMREQELLHQIRLGNDNARRLQTGSDDLQRQINDARAQLEDAKKSRANVNEMATEDLERSRAEVKSLRLRCTELENALNGVSGEEEGTDRTVTIGALGHSALTAELAAREVEVSQLKDQVNALEEVLSGKDQEKHSQFANLTRSIDEKSNELSVLKQQLEQLPTVDEYQNTLRQIETLRSFQNLEDNDLNTSGTIAEGSAADEISVTTESDNLEKRLLTKVKSLEGRIARMRVELEEKDSRINELRVTARTLEEQADDQKLLIGRLEEGISAMTGDPSKVQRLKRRAANASKGEIQLSANPSDTKDSEEDEAWDWAEQHQADNLQHAIREEPSMLDIVAGQRDRFRARTMELEEDNRKLMERIEKLTTDLESLKNDNVKLYEKIRFIQAYKQSNGTMSNAGGNSVHLNMNVPEEEENNGFIGKYKSMYEDMTNPYNLFNRRERHKRMSEMSAPERLTFRASQKAMSTRASRLIVFFYILALHIFTAMVLGFSSGNSCEHDITTKAQH